MKKNNKMIRAYAYVVLGAIVFGTMILAGLYVYFSGTFLPGNPFSLNWVLRKVIYIIILVVWIMSIWFMIEGYNYLKRH